MGHERTGENRSVASLGGGDTPVHHLVQRVHTASRDWLEDYGYTVKMGIALLVASPLSLLFLLWAWLELARIL